MAAAVTRAGAMGSLGVSLQSTDATRADCEFIRHKTNGTYNVNYFVHEEARPDPNKAEITRQYLAAYYEELDLGEVPAAEVMSSPFNEEHLAAMLELKPPVMSFHFGLPSESLFRPLRDRGIFTVSSATNVAEAQALESRGVDAIIAQGFEAGGHRGTFAAPYAAGEIGTLALVPQVVDAVSIPVIAAGGIADGRGIAAALALGAEWAQLGTAFLTCPESAVAPVYRDALSRSAAGDAQITRAFSGRPARGLENRFTREMRDLEDSVPDFPILNALTGPLRKASGQAGNTDFMSLWAGQSAPLSRNLPAEELLEELVKETEQTLRRLISAEPRG